jgi:hypothetical protein
MVPITQDFKLGGVHLEKLCRVEGGTKIYGVFWVKNHDFTQKNHIFSNFRGAPHECPPSPGSAHVTLDRGMFPLYIKRSITFNWIKFLVNVLILCLVCYCIVLFVLKIYKIKKRTSTGVVLSTKFIEYHTELRICSHFALVEYLHLKKYIVFPFRPIQVFMLRYTPLRQNGKLCKY